MLPIKPAVPVEGIPQSEMNVRGSIAPSLKAKFSFADVCVKKKSYKKKYGTTKENKNVTR
jgi:hypothetical protein